MAELTEEMIGAIAFINANPERVYELFPSGIYSLEDDLPSLIKPFLQGEEAGALRRLAKKALKTGTNVRREWVPTFIQGYRFFILPDYPIESVATSVDGTIASSEEDTLKRWQNGPSWNKNSCAPHCCIMLGIWLQIYRVAADQLGTRGLRGLSAPQVAYRNLMLSNIGLATTEQLTEECLYIREEMTKAFPHLGKVGDFVNATLWGLKLFQGVPQMSFHTCELLRCCESNDAKWTATMRTDESGGTMPALKVCSGVSVDEETLIKLIKPAGGRDSGSSVQDIIDAIFGDVKLDTKDLADVGTSCGTGCKRAPSKRRVLFGRHPKTIILTTGWEFHDGKENIGTTKRGKGKRKGKSKKGVTEQLPKGGLRGFFDSITIYWARLFPLSGYVEEYGVEYNPVAYIAHVGSGHYTAAFASGGGEVLVYDDMNGGGCKVMEGTLEDLFPADGAVSMMVYREEVVMEGSCQEDVEMTDGSSEGVKVQTSSWSELL